MNLKYFEDIFKKIVQLQGIKILVQTQLALRVAEVVHRLTYSKRYKPMAQAMDRFKKCDNKKSADQTKKEISLCKKYWGCYPLHYFRYDLYRSDKQLSDKELINYIPEFFFYYLFLPFYDSKKYENLVSDKNYSEQLFKKLAIPQPHIIFKLINNHFYTDDSSVTKFESIRQEVLEKKYKKIFVKPLRGQGGRGIYIFYNKQNNSRQYVTNDNEVFDEKFLNKIGAQNDYIIQVGIEQDLEMKKIYSHSVNTFRFLTENKNENARILSPVFFRVGRNGNQVDNYDQGGLLTTIDVDTGKMGNYASSMDGNCFEKHPDTNFSFKGYKISQWNQIRKFVIKCARKLPQFTYLGWDICITPNGPLVIEINQGTGLDGLQIHSGGLREMFGIENPQLYWRNKGKRL